MALHDTSSFCRNFNLLICIAIFCWHDPCNSIVSSLEFSTKNTDRHCKSLTLNSENSMKNVYLISTLLSVVASASFAQTIEFSMVDADHNGVLNVSELTSVLPEVMIDDVNGDNIVSEEEAVAAIEGLVLPQETEGDDNATVGESDFALLLAALSSAQ
jgi:hypothetical protein